LNKVVVDANVALALAVELPYSAAAQTRMERWQEAGTQLFAPALWAYEITSTLRKLVKQGHLTPQEGQGALQDLLALGIQLVSPTTALILTAYSWAERLEQTVAYDAAYLALAEQEGVELWTGDRRLANSARSHGVTWIHHLED